MHRYALASNLFLAGNNFYDCFFMTELRGKLRFMSKYLAIGAVVALYLIDQWKAPSCKTDGRGYAAQKWIWQQ